MNIKFDNKIKTFLQRELINKDLNFKDLNNVFKNLNLCERKFAKI
jgi:hypothetical protein